MRPIFVVGSARSGTSILAGALIEGAHIAGFLEGHFLPLALPLVSEAERYYGWKRDLLDDRRYMISNVPLAEIRRELLQVFKRHAETLTGSRRWVDKSPDARMIRAAPLMREIWPDAQFVFAKRRGIENVASRMRKFPHVDFEAHCRLWAESMHAWMDVRGQLSDCHIEIEQREIALDPTGTAARLASFLALDPDQHASVARVLRRRRPERTGRIESKRAVAIDGLGWDERQIELFRRHCDAALRAFGYSHDEGYWARPGAGSDGRLSALAEGGNAGE